MKSKKTKGQTKTEQYQKKMEQQRKVRADRLARGLCMYCNRKQDPGRNYCDRHPFSSSYYVKYRSKYKPRTDRRMVHDRINKVLDGMNLCDLEMLLDRELAQKANCGSTTAYWAIKKRIQQLIK
jgi:hypothetical protein